MADPGCALTRGFLPRSPTHCEWRRLCEQISFTLQQPGCSFYFGEGRLIQARYNTWDRRVVSVLACTEVVHPCRGTEGCQPPIPTLPASWQRSTPFPHWDLCWEQEVLRNGKQSHCRHGGADKHIFMWDAEKEASDPPFSPSASFQHRPAPSPAARAGRVRVFFPPTPFQRPSGLQTCLCITVFTSNCYLAVLDQEQSPGGNRAQ